MNENTPLIEKDFFFKQNNNVHIHISDDCKEYVGVPHKHKFIEIVYIISGKAKHIIENNEYHVQKGDISVINSYETHAFLADKNCSDKFLAYDLMFTPDFIDNSCFTGDDFCLLSDSFLFYSLFPDEKDFKERFNLISGCRYELGPVFEKIYFEYKNAKTGYVNLIRIYIAEIIIKLLRTIQNYEKNTLSASQKRIVMDIINYVETNYSMRIRSDEIASKLFFNKNYLSKLFKEETGLSIHEFVKEIRIKEACHLLLTTEKTINEIASDCGFSDMKSFYMIFKKLTAHTPKSYRDSNIG